MKKLFRIKHKHADLYWGLKGSVTPVFTTPGAFYTEDELTAQIKKFKYQRALWPKGSTIEEYTIDESKTKASSIASDLFEELDKELTYEKLNGSSY